MRVSAGSTLAAAADGLCISIQHAGPGTVSHGLSFIKCTFINLVSEVRGLAHSLLNSTAVCKEQDFVGSIRVRQDRSSSQKLILEAAKAPGEATTKTAREPAATVAAFLLRLALLCPLADVPVDAKAKDANDKIR